MGRENLTVYMLLHRSYKSKFYIHAVAMSSRAHCSLAMSNYTTSNNV